MRRVLWALLLAALALPALAVEPGEMLKDPALEARARDIGKHLRCLVCQNQSIDDSGAPLAKDLRVLVRERLTAGESDGQVIDYVVGRYGSFVLLKPPMKPDTYLLWFGPAIVLLAGAAGLVVRARRRRSAAPAPLSDDEKRRLQALIADEAPAPQPAQARPAQAKGNRR